LTATTASTGIAKYIPSLGWLPSYKAGWLRFDLAVGKSIGDEKCPWNPIRKN
jgi:hypothetical protein